MVDGALNLMTLFYGLHQEGQWTLARQSNALDGAAPFYGIYRCRDRHHISIAPIEQNFYSNLIERIGAPRHLLREQDQREKWPDHRRILAEIFSTKTRAEWTELLSDVDCCFAPVLNMAETPSHPHLHDRGSFVEVDGVLHPAPAPRFSKTPSSIRWAPSQAVQGDVALLREWGVATHLLDILQREFDSSPQRKSSS